MRSALLLVLATAALAASGCSDDPAAGADSASAAATTAAPPKTAPPAVSSTPPADSKDCPKDSVGPGTNDLPCVATGASRAMEAAWNNKIDDKGPFFNVKNISAKPILYGKIAVFFYDKAGKQLEVQGTDKKLPYKTCAGDIFQGQMKVDEKALIQFSCVKKADVPDGTAAIEAELITVGFTADGKSSNFFWTNKELAPDARPKGGVQPPKDAKAPKGK